MALNGQAKRSRERHGKSYSRAYSVWESMLSRCSNENHTAYENYGGRGITVCPQWGTFLGFYADMGDPPEGMSLDRRDNDLGYSPENCRWATNIQQARNNRRSNFITAHGVTLTLAEWSERTGIKSHTINARIRKGWSAEEAVSSPLITKRAGIPRGARVRDHQEYGDRHGVAWSEPNPYERTSA